MKTRCKLQFKVVVATAILLFALTSSFANANTKSRFSYQWDYYNLQRTGIYVGFPYGVPSGGASVTVSGTAGSWTGSFTSSGPWQVSTPLPVGQAYTVSVSGIGSSSFTLYNVESQVYTGTSPFYYSPWRYIGVKVN